MDSLTSVVFLLLAVDPSELLDRELDALFLAFRGFLWWWLDLECLFIFPSDTSLHLVIFVVSELDESRDVVVSGRSFGTPPGISPFVSDMDNGPDYNKVRRLDWWKTKFHISAGRNAKVAKKINDNYLWSNVIVSFYLTSGDNWIIKSELSWLTCHVKNGVMWCNECGIGHVGGRDHRSRRRCRQAETNTQIMAALTVGWINDSTGLISSDG